MPAASIYNFLIFRRKMSSRGYSLEKYCRILSGKLTNLDYKGNIKFIHISIRYIRYMNASLTMVFYQTGVLMTIRS